MAARPRKHNLDIPNLYCKLDKRTNKIYWQYRNPVTNKFEGFGTDTGAAKTAAIELNRIFAEQETSQSYALIDMALKEVKASEKATGLRVKAWVIRYCDGQDKRMARGELAKSTVVNRKSCALILAERIPNMLLEKVGVREMAGILEEYIDREKFRMAQLIRSVWVDLFKEAQYAGEVPAGFNPALATKKPLAEVKRQRLQIAEWRRIFDAAASGPPLAQNSMLLAIATGQRLGDITKMKFKDVWDELLHIEQEKTGTKIALPLSLYCDAINMTLAEVINRCRDRAVSQYMIHHAKNHVGVSAGGKVGKGTLSREFAEARDLAGITAEAGKTLPTFHEQRSLAERLYRKQGINTQLLLGHASQEMTDKYNNDRSNQWVVLAV
jgi:integrase